MNENWWGVLVGILLLYSGSVKLFTGAEGEYWGFSVPVIAGFIFLPIGFIFLVVSIRGIWRNKGKSTPKGYTTEEIAQSKAELEAMHLRDYGKSTEDSGKER